ncbi:HD domain-containing protein [Mucilaginibacter sp. PAMB04274]|uniref:HD domain-containing protein n=1 Tax=Mucilaginibacter sp. PAMB04274 TaxID=3138568 RepID=UPI0031F70F36
MEIQSIYQQALLFAAGKHTEQHQTIPGTDLPYVVHLSNVAMELLIANAHTPDFDLGFAIQLALLHDTLEDTNTTFEELETTFEWRVAQGVAALTKNKALPKEQRMQESLNRIKALSKEVWTTKLADRITNLQEPPKHWDQHKRTAYMQEAAVILAQLTGANSYLEQRLQQKIRAYQQYL